MELPVRIRADEFIGEEVVRRIHWENGAAYRIACGACGESRDGGLKRGMADVLRSGLAFQWCWDELLVACDFRPAK